MLAFTFFFHFRLILWKSQTASTTLSSSGGSRSPLWTCLSWKTWVWLGTSQWVAGKQKTRHSSAGIRMMRWCVCSLHSELIHLKWVFWAWWYKTICSTSAGWAFRVFLIQLLESSHRWCRCSAGWSQPAALNPQGPSSWPAPYHPILVYITWLWTGLTSLWPQIITSMSSGLDQSHLTSTLTRDLWSLMVLFPKTIERGRCSSGIRVMDWVI